MADILLIVAFALVMIIGAMILFLLILYNVFRPFREYFMCQLPNSTKKDCIMIIGKDGKISLKAANIWHSEFQQKPDPPYSYIAENITVFKFGDVNIAAFIDDWNVTRDRDLCRTVMALKEDYGIDNYDEFRHWYEQEESGQLTYSDNCEKVPPQNYVLFGKPVSKNAFRKISFEQLFEYLSSVFPKEIDSYIDNETSKYIDKYVLHKVFGNNTILILIIVGIVAFIGLVALGSKALGLW